MNRAELNTYIDTNITDKITSNSLSPTDEGNALKAVADYVDQNDIVKTIKVSLTSAEILALFTTPKVIVPAVTGKLLVLRQIFQKYTHVSTPYTSNLWRIGYNGITFGFVNLSPVITSASDAQGFNPITPSSSAVGGSFIDAPLVIGATTSDPVGGDGTLDIYVTYYEIEI